MKYFRKFLNGDCFVIGFYVMADFFKNCPVHIFSLLLRKLEIIFCAQQTKDSHKKPFDNKFISSATIERVLEMNLLNAYSMIKELEKDGF